MVRTVNMRAAKTHLSRLVNEEFIIAKDGRPVARVTPIRDAIAAPRVGFLPDIEVPDDFDELGAGQIAAAFGGSSVYLLDTHVLLVREAVHDKTSTSCSETEISQRRNPGEGSARRGHDVAVTSSEVWDEATAAAYDVDEAAMFAPEVLDPALDLLAELAGGGPALELAIGTGRVAVPLRRRGIPVTGIELSEPMVRRLRGKAGADELPVTVGDMASTRVEGEFALVYLVWNSLSNLRTQDEQVECFRNAARHLRPGGRFVVELFVPPLRRLPPGQLAAPFDVSEGHLGFDTFDLVTQQCTSHHYTRRPDGSIEHGVGHFRYAWPAELDLMARLAGLELEARYADWSRAPFTSDSAGHVSVWRLP